MDKPFCDISFAEKVRIYSYDYLQCCLYISGFESTEYVFTKRLYAKLISTSSLLEDFLDFHGAKNNKNWYFYRELSASVRLLSLAGYAQQHITNRLNFYDLGDIDKFRREGEKTLEFFRVTLTRLAPAIVEEAKRLNIEIPAKSLEQANFPGVITSEMLENNIDDKEGDDQQGQYIVKIASEFLSVMREFSPFNFYEPYTLEEIKGIVPQKVNEVEMRRFQILVHNLQSSFDTYVVHGGRKYKDPRLKRFRSHFSVAYRLLQIIGRLLHYYERHLLERGYKDIYKMLQEKLSRLVDPEELLDRTMNYALYYVSYYLQSGKTVARELLNEYIDRSSIVVGIPQKLGFHSRPSLMVSKIVQHYGGEVNMLVGDATFDASSVLDIQWAGGKIQKENITKVTFEGDTRALNDIEILASVNYGEDSMGKGIALPPELKYLR